MPMINRSSSSNSSMKEPSVQPFSQPAYPSSPLSDPRHPSGFWLPPSFDYVQSMQQASKPLQYASLSEFEAISIPASTDESSPPHGHFTQVRAPRVHEPIALRPFFPILPRWTFPQSYDVPALATTRTTWSTSPHLTRAHDEFAAARVPTPDLKTPTIFGPAGLPSPPTNPSPGLPSTTRSGFWAEEYLNLPSTATTCHTAFTPGFAHHSNKDMPKPPPVRVALTRRKGKELVGGLGSQDPPRKRKPGRKSANLGARVGDDKYDRSSGLENEEAEGYNS